jgi:repressor LexA
VSITLVHPAFPDKNCLQDFAHGISKWEFSQAKIATARLSGRDKLGKSEAKQYRNQASNEQRAGLVKKLAIRFLFATIMPMAITRRQKEVIDFLSGFTQKNGYSPSYEEIASGLGLSSLATVHKHVTNLQNKGLLQRAHNRSRSIDVLPARSGKKGSDRLPLMGRIAAGQPVEAIETAESISLSDIIGNREVFALEVRGDSMRDEHIVSGDYVLVERTRTAREGEIIVALIDGSDATLKRFYREGSMVRLQPSNTEMSPIYAPAASVSIQGKVLGVLRKYA